MEEKIKRKSSGLASADRKNKLFIFAVAFLPVLQFLIFYVYVNFNAILMAFQTYLPGLDGATGSNGAFHGFHFDNFKRVFSELFAAEMGQRLINSAIYYVVSVLVGTTISLLFSFYIYKNRRFASFFKIVLFLPQIISVIILAIIFEKFIDVGIKDIYLNWLGRENFNSWIKMPDTQFVTVLLFSLWFSFGGGVLIYTSTMSGISESLVEAAELDGANTAQEFWHVTLPGVYPTISTFIVTGLAAFFTTDMNLYSFLGSGANPSSQTIGYYFLNAMRSMRFKEYPYLSALGFTFTIVTIPLIIGVRKALNKLGPSVD